MESNFNKIFKRLIQQNILNESSLLDSIDRDVREQELNNQDNQNNQDKQNNQDNQNNQGNQNQKQNINKAFQLCSIIQIKDLPEDFKDLVEGYSKKFTVTDDSYCVVIKNVQDPSFQLITKMIYYNILNRYSGDSTKAAEFNIWKSANISYDGGQYTVFIFYQTDAINKKVQLSFKNQFINELQAVAKLIPMFIDANI